MFTAVLICTVALLNYYHIRRCDVHMWQGAPHGSAQLHFLYGSTCFWENVYGV